MFESVQEQEALDWIRDWADKNHEELFLWGRRWQREGIGEKEQDILNGVENEI